MKLFYCRVSTAEQREDRQVKAALDLGIERENIYIDKFLILKIAHNLICANYFFVKIMLLY